MIWPFFTMFQDWLKNTFKQLSLYRFYALKSLRSCSKHIKCISNSFNQVPFLLQITRGQTVTPSIIGRVNLSASMNVEHFQFRFVSFEINSVSDRGSLEHQRETFVWHEHARTNFLAIFLFIPKSSNIYHFLYSKSQKQSPWLLLFKYWL